MSIFQPTTEKVHQIIARTAMFVSKHGGQSEIVLRVKQGDNPSFGFLMPDHHLHAYFRYLVDHQGLLQPDFDGKPFHGEKISSNEHGGGGGALSLLGSLYGSMEDEDGASENASAHKENASGEASDVSAAVSHDSDKQESPVTRVVKDEAASTHVLPSKEKVTSLKKNSFVSASKAVSSGMKKEGDSSILLSAATAKLHAPLLATSKKEPLILEPPSDLKRLVEKIVEFIMKNGKQFEAVLMEQDSEHGRFPFLLPSNQYHSYYIKVLQKAQESKLTGKSFLNDKDGLVGHGPDKKTSRSKERDTLSPGSAGCDIPNDSDRKEKFKMVLGKSKKDGQDPPKTTQQQFGVRVDAAAAAAILQAATRGIRNPNLGFLSSTDMNGNNYGRSNEGGQASSLGSRLSSQPDNTTQKSNPSGEREVSVPVAKAIAKTAALEAASEADSSEAHLTKEHKLKAERLRRAKMFVTMLKSGAPPLKTELSRGLSAEPQVSGVSGSVAEVNLPVKEREGSSAPLDVGISDKNEVSQRKHSGDENNERRSRRKYRSRSSRHEGEEEEDEKEEDNDEKLELKHSKKKHHSRCSSPEVEEDSEEGRVEEERGDRHSKKKHRLHRSSNKDDELKDEDEWDHKYSRKKHRSHRSLREKVDEEDEEERDHRLSRKKHRSHHSSRHSKEGNSHKKKHSSSKDREFRYRRKHDISSDDEHRHQSRSNKLKKGSHSEQEELEEGEISPKISDQSRGSVGGGASREASVDLSRAPSQPSETTEVSEDLRAKIRAMLMATM